MRCYCAQLKKPRVWKGLFFWISALLGLSVVLLNCYDCLLRYLAKHTGTSDLYKHTSKVPFPDLTFCPVKRYKENILKNNGIENISEYIENAQWVSKDVTKAGPEELYHEVTFPVEEIIDWVEVYLDRYFKGSEKIVLNLTTNPCGGSEEKVFLTREYYYNGNCYSIVMPDCLHQTGPVEVIISLKEDVDVFIHHSGQFMSPNSRSRVRIKSNRDVKVSVTHETVQMLEEFGTCTYTYQQGSYDNCIYQQMSKKMLEEIGCTVPWLPNRSKICIDVNHASQARDFYHKNRRNQEDICKDSCQLTNVYLGPIVEEVQSSYTRAIFYLRRDIKKSTEYLVYQELTLLAESGGIVGLVLGVSVFHVRYLFYYLIDYWFCNTEEDLSNE